MMRLAKHLVRLFLYYSGIWLLFRYFNRHKIAILMYHGVTDKPSEFWTQLAEKHFRLQMAYLHRSYRSITLEQAIEAIKRNERGQSYGVAVTFDDGFHNNFQFAFPVLKAHGIFGTIFLTTSFIDGTAPYNGLIWTDYIRVMIINAPDNELDLGPHSLAKYPLDNAQKRRQAGDDICRRLKKLPQAKRDEIISELSRKFQFAMKAEERDMLAPLSWDSARQMTRSDLISFGAHTVTHPILTRINLDDARNEIVEAKAKIEKMLEMEIKYFAYPNGTRDDYNSAIKKIVADSYAGALTTIAGSNSPGDDIYELRRINIGSNMTLMEFKLALAGLP